MENGAGARRKLVSSMFRLRLRCVFALSFFWLRGQLSLGSSGPTTTRRGSGSAGVFVIPLAALLVRMRVALHRLDGEIAKQVG